MTDYVTSYATISVHADLPGFHHWPGADGTHAYLGRRHRHLFGVTVTFPVVHDQREVEFHDLLMVVRNWWSVVGNNGEWGGASCETIARQLATDLAGQYDRTVTAAVSEDGECTATVTVSPSTGEPDTTAAAGWPADHLRDVTGR